VLAHVGRVAAGRRAPAHGLGHGPDVVRRGAAAQAEVADAEGQGLGGERGDLRAISQDQIDRVEAKMRTIVAQSLAGAHAEISFDPDIYPPMPPTDGNRALLAELNGVNRDMALREMGELDAADRGAGDISFVASEVSGLAGLGPSSSGSHTATETVDIPSIFKQAKRAAILMSRLSREHR